MIFAPLVSFFTPISVRSRAMTLPSASLPRGANAILFAPIGLGAPDPEFRSASPFKKMPALVDGDYQLSDSSAIIHYLEAKYPEPELIPADPRERGRVIWFDEFADTLLFACGAKIFFNKVVAPRFLGREGDLDIAEAAERDELPPLLDYLEGVIPESGYLVGDAFTVADLTAAAMFAALLELPEIQYPVRVALPNYHREYRDSLAEHPAARWIAEIYRRHRGRSAEIPRDRTAR